MDTGSQNLAFFKQGRPAFVEVYFPNNKGVPWDDDNNNNKKKKRENMSLKPGSQWENHPITILILGPL